MKECIFVISLLQMLLVVNGCSPVIEVTNLALSLYDVCTASSNNNDITFEFTITTSPENEACSTVQLQINSIGWILFALNANYKKMTTQTYTGLHGLVEDSSVTISLSGQGSSGDLEKVYGLSALVKFESDGSEDSRVIVGYFVHGCVGTRFSSDYDENCNGVFHTLQVNYSLEYCGNTKSRYGDACQSLQTVVCNKKDSSPNIRLCEEADVTYGNLVNEISGPCTHRSTYYITDKGIWTKSACKAKFEFCVLQKVDGGWSPWPSWSTCNVTCGGGLQYRERSCTNPAPQYGGDVCLGEHREYQTCGTIDCPVDGAWSSWPSWSTCNVTCGGGLQYRERSCTNPTPQFGGDVCPGEHREYQICGTIDCPVDGGWSPWPSWSTCNVTCGGGLQYRERSCTNPAPQYGGDVCLGEHREYQTCGTYHCPEDLMSSNIIINEESVDKSSNNESEGDENGETPAGNSVNKARNPVPESVDSNVAQHAHINTSVRCISNCGILANPEEAIEVYVDCEQCASQPVSFHWSHTQCGSELINSCSPWWIKDMLNVESRYYRFTVHSPSTNTQYQAVFVTVIFMDGRQSNTSEIFKYSPVPVAGVCDIVPQTGYAILTNFNITCTNFSVADGLNFTYTMYANTRNTTSKGVRIHKGGAVVLGVKLQEGISTNNYTIYIFIKAILETGASTQVIATVQVFPPSQSDDGRSSLSLVTDLALDSEAGGTNQIDQLLNTGNSDAAVQLIGIVTSTLNNMNVSTAEDVGKKTEVRTEMVSNLGKMNVSDFEALSTVTAVLNDVTQVKSELTEKAQDEATDLYDGLADSLDVFVNNTGSKTQVTETATSILQGVTGILTIVTENGKTKLENTTSSQLNDSDVEDEVALEKVKNSTGKLLSTLDKVSGSILGQQLVDQPPTIMKADTVTISVQKMSSDRLINKTLSPDDSLNGSTSSLKFDSPVPTLNNNVGIKMMGMQKNPFIWDKTAENVNSDVLTVDLTYNNKTKVTVINLASPVLISLPISGLFIHNLPLNNSDVLNVDLTYNNKTEVTVNNFASPVLISLLISDSQPTSENQSIFYLHLMKANNTIQYDSTKSNMLLFNFTLVRDKTAVLKVTPASNITQYKILLSDLQAPSIDEVVNSGFIYPTDSAIQTQYTNFTLSGHNISHILQTVNEGFLYFHHNLSKLNDTQTIFVGLSVDVNNTDSLVQLKQLDPSCLGDDGIDTCTSKIEISVTLETKLLSCTYWDEIEQSWSNNGCEVSSFTTKTTLQCACTHLTSFAGGVFVLPNYVDPIGDAALFLTFFDNPVVITAVLIVWIIYFFIVHWARRADKQDLEQVGVIHCPDNDVTHQYSYLVCIVTGWWKEAGTTSNVFIYIQGSDGASPRRKLSTTSRLCFQTGYEDWFLITTEHRLGDIQQITLWHDNTGTSPHWYLSQAYIQDTHTGNSWMFIYNDWLSADRGSILQTTGTVTATTKEQLKFQQKHNFMMKTVAGFRDGHLWISVFSKSARSSFTRVQRVTCALSLLLTTMLTNIMFYGIPTDEPADQVGGVGGIRISLSALVIGIQSSLIMFPVNILILQLFTRVKPRTVYMQEQRKLKVLHNTQQHSKLKTAIKNKDDVMKQIHLFLEKSEEEQFHDVQSSIKIMDKEAAKSTMMVPKVQAKGNVTFLPWWFLYISWSIVILVCLISSYFVMLYGLKYGYDTSVEWLVSFLTGFTQSAFVVQPLKVICIAVLMALILKKTSEVEDIGPNIGLEKDEEYVYLAKDHKEAHVPYTEPLSSKLLAQIKHRLKLEWLMNTTILDIILYTVYITIVMLVVHGHRDIKQAYRNTVAIEDVYVNPGCIKLWQCFFLEKADKVETFYQYLFDVAKPNLEDMSIADHNYTTPGSSHFLLGPYRLRQVRVDRGACASGMDKLFSTMDMRLPECTGVYWWGDEDNKHYNLNWTIQDLTPPTPPTMWSYQTAWKLKTIPYTGKLATYSGGGYVLTMPDDFTLHQGILANIWTTEWIDERTRAIFLEFTLYNPNADLFSAVRIIFEFSNSGLILPHHQIFTTKLFHYSTDFGIFLAVCEIMFLVFNVGFTRIEYKRYKKLGRKEYFSDKWSYVELLQIALSFSVIGLFFQRLISVHGVMKDYRSGKGEDFVSFYTAISWDYILGYVMAFLVCLLTLKFIKLLEFNRRIFMLSDTLSQSKAPLFSFVVVAVIFAVAFSHFAYTTFGRILTDYRSMSSSFLTLFNFALGVSDFPGLQNTNRVLGPIFFFVFVFVVQILCLSVFIVILNFGINESKSMFGQRRNKFELLEYITSKAKLIINFK